MLTDEQVRRYEDLRGYTTNQQGGSHPHRQSTNAPLPVWLAAVFDTGYNLPMLRQFRLFLAAVLIVAMPLQGIAAVKACFCSTLEHQDGDGATHSHDRGDDATHTPSLGHDLEPGRHSHTKALTQSHCGPCAACWVVAVVGVVPQ